VLVIPSNSGIKARLLKNVYELYGCGFQWNVARVFSTFQPAAERNLITALTCNAKLEVGG